jgi:VWFA-related protein
VNVLVLDKQKAPQQETDAAQFRVLEDGAAQTILSLSGSEAPVSLGLVVDVSGSTCPVHPKDKSACPSFDPIISSLPELTRGLPAGSEVMVTTFEDHAYLDLKFAPAEKFDIHLFAKLRAGGGTAFYDALVATEDYFAKNAKFKRRVIVVISDGDDNASTMNLEQAIHRISCASTPMLYAINTTSEHIDDYSFSERRHSARALELLAESVGGIVVPAYGKKHVPVGVQSIANAIREQVSLQYSSSNAASDEKARKLEVAMPAAVGKLSILHEKQFFRPLP